MATQHTSPYGSWVLFTLLGATATLRYTGRINNLATVIIATALISQYYINRNSARSIIRDPVDIAKLKSQDEYIAQLEKELEERGVSVESLKSALEASEASAEYYESMTKSMIASGRAHEMRIKELVTIIDDYEQAHEEHALSQSQIEMEQSVSEEWEDWSKLKNLTYEEELKQLEVERHKIEELRTDAAQANQKAQERLEYTRKYEDLLHRQMELLKIKDIMGLVDAVLATLKQFHAETTEASTRAKYHKAFVNTIIKDLKPTQYRSMPKAFDIKEIRTKLSAVRDSKDPLDKEIAFGEILKELKSIEDFHGRLLTLAKVDIKGTFNQAHSKGIGEFLMAYAPLVKRISQVFDKVRQNASKPEHSSDRRMKAGKAEQ